MSFRSRSPCLILEFVAMGRERSSGEERDEDNFLCLARDWRVPVRCCDRLAKPSNEGDFGW